MEIQVGEYIRTKNGIIAKLEDVTEDNVYFFDRTMYTSYTDSIEFLREDELNEYVIKHSFNIIDLIEKGDYVNGHKIVNEIYGEDDNNLYFEIEGGFNKAKYIGEEEIKSIVTKEMFLNAEYRVETD